MLVAEGNAQDPVILTGISHRRGAWRGITIENSTQKNRLQYLTIEYAGSESAALDVTASVLDLEHSVIRESASLAMSMTLPPTDFAVFRNNTFSHNAEGLFVDAQTLMDLDALSTYSGNDRDGIELFNLSGGWPITLHSLGVPYRAMPLVRRGGCHD
jgi:hypothetical protein